MSEDDAHWLIGQKGSSGENVRSTLSTGIKTGAHFPLACARGLARALRTRYPIRLVAS